MRAIDIDLANAAVAEKLGMEVEKVGEVVSTWFDTYNKMVAKEDK